VVYGKRGKSNCIDIPASSGGVEAARWEEKKKKDEIESLSLGGGRGKQKKILGGEESQTDPVPPPLGNKSNSMISSGRSYGHVAGGALGLVSLRGQR